MVLRSGVKGERHKVRGGGKGEAFRKGDTWDKFEKNPPGLSPNVHLFACSGGWPAYGSEHEKSCGIATRTKKKR